jgi:tRNA threonylcarbamoyladenosine biosynthesis protein TsaB
MSARILALDTATEACSAAVAIDGEIIAQRFELAPRRHAELILAQLDAVLAEAELTLPQIDALAYGRGPGAFTGVRLAVSVTQGVAFAAELPVLPVSDLAALAYGAWRESGSEHLACAIDARMSEVYWGCYCADPSTGVRLIGEESVLSPQALSLPTVAFSWQGVGSGWALPELASRLAVQSTSPTRFPAAADIALLASLLWQQGAALPAQQALPVYLRDRIAQPSLKTP